MLDKAPISLVSFNTAGGDPQFFKTTRARSLAAICAGAVFIGANNWIGNAPKLMVKAIAEDRGGKMPSFLRYRGWSVLLLLLPLFGAVTPIWF